MTTTTLTLTDFLLARYDEDEADARAAIAAEGRLSGEWWALDGGVRTAETDDDGNALGWPVSLGVSRDTRVHIARHDPARVLAEVEANRRIVALHPHGPNGEHVCADPRSWNGEQVFLDGCPTLLALASVYAAHPDYRPEWSL